jgi:hypothetical protein
MSPTLFYVTSRRQFRNAVINRLPWLTEVIRRHPMQGKAREPRCVGRLGGTEISRAERVPSVLWTAEGGSVLRPNTARQPSRTTLPSVVSAHAAW